MDCETEAEFRRCSTTFIYKTVYCRGYEFRKFKKTDLLNTIATAFGHQVRVPETEEELKQAESGKIFLFDKKGEEHANYLYKQIKKVSPQTVQFKIIPLVLYREKKYYQMPLFCIKTNYGLKYVDDSGRIYEDVDHWKETNILPSGLLAYPTDLKMDKEMTICFEKTPETFWKRRIWTIIDGIAAALGIISVIPGIIIPGGQIIMIAVLLYGTARNAYKLYDRKSHGQSISLGNSDARKLWFSLAASSLSCLSIGVLYHVSSLAGQGETFTKAAITALNVLNISNHIASGVSIINDAIYVLCNWKSISIGQKLLMVAQMAFLALSAFNFKSADQLIENFRSEAIKDMTQKMPGTEINKVTTMRAEMGDQQFLKMINTKALELGVSHKAAIEIVIGKVPSNCTGTSSFVVSDLTGICLDTLTNSIYDKVNHMIKSGNTELSYISQQIPEIGVNFVTSFMGNLEKSQEGLDVNEYCRAVVAIIGLIANMFSNICTTRQAVNNARIDVTQNIVANENIERQFEILGFTENTDLNKDIWIEIIEHFNAQDPSELYDSIKNIRVLTQMIGLYPIKKNKTDIQLKLESEKCSSDLILNVIEHGNLKFGSEITALFHYITQGLLNGEIDVKNYMQRANCFICEDNIKKIEINGKERLFYYKKDDSTEQAVVSEEEGYLKLCSYKIK